MCRTSNASLRSNPYLQNRDGNLARSSSSVEATVRSAVVAKKTQPPGCRDAAIATVFLLGLAIVFLTVGLTMTQRAGCEGLCETLGLTLLYAGGPVSALFGVLFGDLPLAWPLDITFWVVTGFVTARWAENRSRGVLGIALVILLLALAYGLVLSRFVEIVV